MIETYTPHRFNPQVAELYGVNAALLFQYFCFCSKQTPKRWVDPTLEELCKQYPYLGEWQVWAALQKLINSGKKTPALLLRKQVQGTYLYAPVTNDDAAPPHVFDVRVALQVGVIPAVIYHNVGHWIRENWKRRAETLNERLDPEDFDFSDYQMQRYAYQMTRGAAAHYTTAAEWITKHPYVSERTAKRGFSCLQSVGLLRKGLRKRNKQFWHLTRQSLALFEQEMLSKSDLGNPSAKTQTERPKPKAVGQNPNRTAKTQTKSELSDCTEDDSGAYVEADIVEAKLRLKKPVGDNHAAFRSGSLAVAREAAGTASNGATPSASPEEHRRWNSPNLPVEKKHKPIVRKRAVKIPQPDDPEYYEYLDRLTPAQQVDFLASGS